MPFDRRSSSPETRPLLEDAPPSYHSTADDSSSCSSDVPEYSETMPPPLNVFSKVDTCWILAGLWSGVFLGALDGTVVATLLAPIGSHFKQANQSSYIGTAYLLSVCCFTPLYGRLSEVLGRKGAMLLALTLFGFGTICCGFAPSMKLLIAARAVAGMGGGGVMTVASIILTDMIPLKQRGIYQGMANILYGLGAGIGGPFGGWVNDSFGWKAAFVLQAPILLFSISVVAWKVNIQLPPEVESQTLKEKLRRIDFMGSGALICTVACLLLGFDLKTTEELPWSHPLIIGLFLTCSISAFVFIYTEKYLAPFPVMPLRLVTQRTPLAVSLSNLFASMAAFSMIYNIPLYFSAVRMYSAADSGAHLLPHSVFISIGSIFAGWVMRRTGKLYTLTLISSGLSIFASVLVASWDDHTATAHHWIDLIPQGFGMASFITTTLIAMIAGVVRADMAMATGITYLFRTTGQVLGVSLSGAILQGVLLAQLRSRITGPGATEMISRIRHSTSSIRDLDPETQRHAISSYAVALRVVFIVQVAWNVLAFISCLPIQENVLPGTHQEQEQHSRDQDNSSDSDP